MAWIVILGVLLTFTGVLILISTRDEGEVPKLGLKLVRPTPKARQGRRGVLQQHRTGCTPAIQGRKYTFCVEVLELERSTDGQLVKVKVLAVTNVAEPDLCRQVWNEVDGSWVRAEEIRWIG